MSADVLVPQIQAEQQRLESLMQTRLGNRVRNLRVHLRDGGLVLKGRTGTYHVKQLAQHAAMELGTTPILANDIEVLYTASLAS